VPSPTSSRSNAQSSVEAGGRLVQEQHGRGGHERRRQVEAPAHAPGERLDEPVGVLGQAEPLEQLVRAPPRERPRLVVQAADQLEVGSGAEQAVDRRGLPSEPDARAHRGRVGHDVETVDERRARGGLGEGGEDADGRRLARAVVAEEAEDAAGGHLEVEVAERPELAEALAEALCGNARVP
jgi:hypothetical protein